MTAIARRVSVLLLIFVACFISLICAPWQAWAEGPLAAGGISAQDVEYDNSGDEAPTYSFESGSIRVEDVSAGTVSYDPETKTLTLDNVCMYQLYLNNCPELTVNLVGEITLGTDYWGDTTSYAIYDAYYDDSGTKCNLAIIGDGSLNGCIYSRGNLTVSSNVVANMKDDCSCAIYCGGNLAIVGGSIEANNSNYGYGYAAIYSAGNVEISGGTVNAKSSGRYVINCGGDFTMSAGTVKASAADGYSAIRCSGNLEKTGGSMEVEGNVRCYGNMSINDDTTITGNVYCERDEDTGSEHNLSMSGGAVEGYVDCDGDFSMSGGTITKIGSDENYRSNSAVYFGGNFTMTGGKITAKNTSYGISHNYNGSHINHIMTVTGGTIECISPSYGGIDLYETNVAIEGGTIKVTGAYQFDFHVRSNTYRGITYGGEFSISAGTVQADIDCSGSFTMLGGSVEGGVDCSGGFAMSGGSVSGGVRCGEGFTLSSGSVAGKVDCDDGFSMSGGSVAGGVRCGDGFTMSSGSVAGGVDCGEGFTLSSGSIKGSVHSGGAFTMKSGSISASNVDTGVSANGPCWISGGTIVIANPSYHGISVSGGNLTMTGGTVKILNSHQGGIDVWSDTYRSKTRGGNVIITGGNLYVTVRKPSQNSAISAHSVSNKIACLKKISGQLSNGAKFKAGKNEYSVTNYSSVILTKYGAKSKKPKFKTVKYGGYKYDMRGVGSKAFATKAGKKVKSITFKNSLERISAKAFAGTKSLTKLKISYLPIAKYTYKKNGRLKSIKLSKGDYASISKKAFSKCGKKKGKKLMLVYGTNGVYKDDAKVYKKLFKSKGLPRGAQLKTYQ